MNQLKLATQLASSKANSVGFNQGRPRLITAIEKYMSAIIIIYLPGNYGGLALADVLSGDVNPPVNYLLLTLLTPIR